MLALAGIGKLVTSRLGLVLLAGFLVFQAWWWITPTTPPLDRARADAAAHVAEDIASTLGEAAGVQWSGRYVAVAPLAGDDTGYLRNRLEAALTARANCRVITDTVVTDLREHAVSKLARLGAVSRPTADAWKPAPVTTLSQALDRGRRTQADFVVYGYVPAFRLAETGVALAVDVAVADVAAGGTIFEQRFEYGGPLTLASGNPGAGNVGAGWRLLGWLFFVLLLPLVTGGAWRNLLDNESLAANAAALGFLTTLDALLAWALLGFSMPTLWVKAVFGIACLAAFTWNLAVLGFYEQHRCETWYGV